MQMFPGWRIHVEFIDRSAHRFEQVRPRLQGFRRHATTTRLRLTLRTAIKQRDAHTRARQPFGRERSGGTGSDDNHIETLHALVIINRAVPRAVASDRNSQTDRLSIRTYLRYSVVQTSLGGDPMDH